MPDETRLLTADEVAERLGVPKTWVYARAREGGIPTVRLGRYCRFRPQAIEDWIAERAGRRLDRFPLCGQLRNLGQLLADERPELCCRLGLRRVVNVLPRGGDVGVAHPRLNVCDRERPYSHRAEAMA